MTKAEKEMVLWLIEDGGADTCAKCVHSGKPSCPQYVAEDDYSSDPDCDVCISGMVAYFENKQSNQK